MHEGLTRVGRLVLRVGRRLVRAERDAGRAPAGGTVLQVTGLPGGQLGGLGAARGEPGGANTAHLPLLGAGAARPGALQTDDG